MILKNILLILSISIYGCAFTQTPPTSVLPTENNITNGRYFTDNNINKFTGTWRWVSGSDTVIISLKKLKTTYDDLPGIIFYRIGFMAAILI